MPVTDGSELGTDRRTFGAGLKRKRVEFVPAETPREAATPTAALHHSLSERYLSIALKDRVSSSATSAQNGDTSNTKENNVTQTASGLKKHAICKICKLLIYANEDEAAVTPLHHEVSLAHQVCVEHSHPPSHLDRTRQGLKYLSAYGWDPDSRLGLGSSGGGIRVPIKATAKHDTVGLGVELPEGKKKVQAVVEKLNAKEVRNLEAKDKKRRAKLQQMFYGNDDLERYLGA